MELLSMFSTHMQAGSLTSHIGILIMSENFIYFFYCVLKIYFILFMLHAK